MNKALYSFTSSIMIIGFFAFLYGIHTLSFTVFIEGLFLLWIGFSLTANFMTEH